MGVWEGMTQVTLLEARRSQVERKALSACAHPLNRPAVDVRSSPRLQVRWFGDGLGEAESAHQPIRVLRALALGRHGVGEDLGGLG